LAAWCIWRGTLFLRLYLQLFWVQLGGAWPLMGTVALRYVTQHIRHRSSAQIAPWALRRPACSHSCTTATMEDYDDDLDTFGWYALHEQQPRRTAPQRRADFTGFRDSQIKFDDDAWCAVHKILRSCHGCNNPESRWRRKGGWRARALCGTRPTA
jgi:hypothetical protein